MSFYIMILFVFFLLKNIYYVVLSVNFNFFSNSFVVLITNYYYLSAYLGLSRLFYRGKGSCCLRKQQIDLFRLLIILDKGLLHLINFFIRPTYVNMKSENL